jgi:hypothetical protein
MELYEQGDRRTDSRLANDMEKRGCLWMPVPKPLPLRQVIRAALLNALAYTGGDQKKAAACLDLSPRVLGFQMGNHHIPLAWQGIDRSSPRASPHVAPTSLIHVGSGRRQRARRTKEP